MKLTPDIDLMECLWHIQFQVKRSKVKVTGVIWSFCCVGSMDPWLFDRSFQVLVLFALGLHPYLTESLHMWHTYSTTHEKMCCTQFSGWKVKGQGHTGHLKFLLCPLRGFLLIWPNHFICGIYTTHEGAMCHAPFSGSKVKVTRIGQRLFFAALGSLTYLSQGQSIRGRCGIHHFQVKGQGHTDCCKICHVCSIGLCLLHRFAVVFTTWLCAYLIEFWQLRCVTAIRSLDLPVLLSTRQNFHNLTCLFKSVWQRISTPSMISRLTPPNELVFSFHTWVRLKKKKIRTPTIRTPTFWEYPSYLPCEQIQDTVQVTPSIILKAITENLHKWKK